MFRKPKTHRGKKVYEGWKVVRVTPSGDYRSAVIQTAGDTTYTKGQWVVPPKKCGPLCVFSRRVDATNFMFDYCYASRWTLRRCLYTRSSKQRVWQPEHDISGKEYRDSESIESLSTGKILAEEVMVL